MAILNLSFIIISLPVSMWTIEKTGGESKGGLNLTLRWLRLLRHNSLGSLPALRCLSMFIMFSHLSIFVVTLLHVLCLIIQSAYIWCGIHLDFDAAYFLTNVYWWGHTAIVWLIPDIYKIMHCHSCTLVAAMSWWQRTAFRYWDRSKTEVRPNLACNEDQKRRRGDTQHVMHTRSEGGDTLQVSIAM